MYCKRNQSTKQEMRQLFREKTPQRSDYSEEQNQRNDPPGSRSVLPKGISHLLDSKPGKWCSLLDSKPGKWCKRIKQMADKTQTGLDFGYDQLDKETAYRLNIHLPAIV
ncbi:hypothetical protein QYM36_012020 [Artemia franciscana]|uniref:Uncharacterized protein n=1 Tax=Artemia franciscana TaxID=6661 RepID=A0AA88L7A8_ARTSF|nr:hypothetical protein QYM36_012020 [Artemia franciscana]